MIAPTRNIALLLFLRSEQQEVLAKPLVAAGRRINKAIFQKLNQQARRQARLSGLPLFVVKGRQQKGRTFGERLANAFEYVFEQGYSRVIAIGNDCLALDASRLEQAAEGLEQADVVLGPAVDGGVYLLGLSQQAYRRTSFLELPWQTGRLRDALRRYALQKAYSPFFLREEEDADNALDFRRLIRELPFRNRLRQAVESLLAWTYTSPSSVFLSLSNPSNHFFLNRGPPSFLSRLAYLNYN